MHMRPWADKISFLLKEIVACCLLALFLLLSPLQGQVQAAESHSLVSSRLESLGSYLAVVSFRPALDLELTLWQQGEHWRQEWVQAGQDPELIQVAVGRGNRLRAAYPSRDAISLPLLMLWHRPEGSSGWQELGLDPGHRGYAFQEDLPCRVLGRQTQLWLDIEKELPRRLILPSGLQLDWLQYQEVGNYPLPHQVHIKSPSFHLQGQIIWKAVNTELAQDLFQRVSGPDYQNPEPDSLAARELLQWLPRALR